MDFDDVLQEVGSYGRFQKRLLWLAILPAAMPCAFHAYSQLFIAGEPDHWCRIPEFPNIPKNSSIPFEVLKNGTEIVYSKCSMYDLNYTAEQSSDHDVPIVTCKNGWVYDKSQYESSAISEWDLVCSESFWPTIALVLFGLSGLIGNWLFGYAQDRLGRKPSFFIYLIIQLIFGVATAFAFDFRSWMVFRIGVGFTVPAILSTPIVLAIELVGPEERALCNILINVAYSFALIILAGVAWAVKSWREFSLAVTLPFAPLLLLMSGGMPESPRWLIATGKIQKCEKLLLRIAKANGKTIDDELVTRLKGKLHRVVSYDTKSKYGLRDLFKGPRLRLKTSLITYIWFTNTSVYVGLSYYAPALAGDHVFNFFLAAVVELPTYLWLWPSIERWGRRWTLGFSMAVGGVACLATALVADSHVLTLALYSVGKMGISCSFVALPLMASELYPTVVRGLGMSVSSVAGMLGPILIPLVTHGNLGGSMSFLPLVIMGGLLVTGAGAAVLLPETLHQPLPQNLEDAEKQGLTCACCEPPPPQKIPEAL